MPENDSPQVSLKKALRALSAAQKYLNRVSGSSQDVIVAQEQVLAAKESIAWMIKAEPVEGRCHACRTGFHHECHGCLCSNQWHKSPS